MADIKGLIINSDNLKAFSLDLFYPIGSIYISMNSTNPEQLFGGKWTQIVDKFLYCTNSSNQTSGANSISYTPAGSISGTVEGHKLTTSEMPSHGGHLTGNAGGVTGKGNAKGAWLREDNIHTSTNTNAYGWNYSNNEYYPYNVSTGGNGSHSHGFTGSFTGTTSTISTMPSYITCYAWYRTA